MITQMEDVPHRRKLSRQTQGWRRDDGITWTRKKDTRAKSFDSGIFIAYACK